LKIKEIIANIILISKTSLSVADYLGQKELLDTRWRGWAYDIGYGD
jgi:hypothetical protein